MTLWSNNKGPRSGKKEGPVTPQRILRLSFDFFPSAILSTVVELELFTVLAEHGSLTHLQIRELLHLYPRATPDFPDCLCAYQLLEREGHGDEAMYSNTPETALFLDKHRPGDLYIGDQLERCTA
jgi:hypothetical protein